MTLPKPRSELTKDKRRNNGRPTTGMTEDRQLITGPRATFEAMRLQAQNEGVSISEIWRRAARKYLETLR